MNLHRHYGCFALWSKLERMLISTNLIARNQDFSLTTLHTRGQRLLLYKMLTWQYFFTKATES